MKRSKTIYKAISLGIFITLLFSSITAVAVRNYPDKVETIEKSTYKSLDYTHTVLVEVGTATWCPSCPASNAAWHNIYESGNYNFEYCEMVVDKNSAANSHMNAYNLYWVPTSYFDGGQFVYPGTNYNSFYNYLDSSGARDVPDLVADLDAEWLGNAQMNISLSITNNEAAEYQGHLRVYIVEPESTLWNDYGGTPYHHAFLDFAIDQAINIPAYDEYTDSIIWDGVAEGFPDVTYDNIQVILAVFGDKPHQSYSDPPNGAPFWAYYVDETVATLPWLDNEPPEDPIIDGPTSGTAGEEYDYTFSAVDPDGDDVYLWIEWGEGNETAEWEGPYESGEEVTFSHTWEEEGTYTIQAKAKDTYDFESNWSTLEVKMPVMVDLGSTFLRGVITKPRMIHGGHDITFRAIRLHYNSNSFTEHKIGVCPFFTKIVLPNDFKGVLRNHYVLASFNGKLDI